MSLQKFDMDRVRRSGVLRLWRADRGVLMR